MSLLVKSKTSMMLMDVISSQRSDGRSKSMTDELDAPLCGNYKMGAIPKFLIENLSIFTAPK